MGLPRQEYWSGLPFPPPEDLSHSGVKPVRWIVYQWATRKAQVYIYTPCLLSLLPGQVLYIPLAQQTGKDFHMNPVGVISGGLGLKRPFLQWLEAGLGFPARDWAWVRVVVQWILTTRPVVIDKDPGPLALQERKEFPQRQELMKQVKYFLGDMRVQYMWRNTWAYSEGESLSYTLVAVWITFTGHFFQISFHRSF